ncbi:hypothetical protein Y1Q_0019641 [Alligator mississippiensis]|uniref:Uncharacterized protein n=1 Tax=Alligator mississippiensis TaxID=8496 RepID=A0A151PEP9_ALLMI|nr:hypothetical protein Y1Q_0019641 [Alligator mississippiensis]
MIRGKDEETPGQKRENLNARAALVTVVGEKTRQSSKRESFDGRCPALENILFSLTLSPHTKRKQVCIDHSTGYTLFHDQSCTYFAVFPVLALILFSH